MCQLQCADTSEQCCWFDASFMLCEKWCSVQKQLCEESELAGTSFVLITGTWTYILGQFQVSGQIRMQTWERVLVFRCTTCLSILAHIISRLYINLAVQCVVKTIRHIIQLSALGKTCPCQLSCSFDILICLPHKELIFPFLLGTCQPHYIYFPTV